MTLTIDEYHDLLGEVSHLGCVSLHETLDHSEEGRSFLDSLEDIGGPVPDDLLEKEEMTRMMADILEELAEKERLVIALYYYEELTQKEIAEVLSVSEGRSLPAAQPGPAETAGQTDQFRTLRTLNPDHRGHHAGIHPSSHEQRPSLPQLPASQRSWCSSNVNEPSALRKPREFMALQRKIDAALRDEGFDTAREAFSASLKTASLTTDLQRPRLENMAKIDKQPPEKYRILGKLASQGMGADEIATILGISPIEASQLLSLSNMAKFGH